jgi:hypothetical protein
MNLVTFIRAQGQVKLIGDESIESGKNQSGNLSKSIAIMSVVVK